MLGVAVTVADRTDRDRLRDGLRLVNEAGRRIGSSLDVFRTAQELADTAVRGLAAITAVDVLDLVLQGETPRPAPLPDPFAMRRAGFAHSLSDDIQGIVPIGQVRLMRFGSPQGQSLVDLRPRLVRRLRLDDEWLLRDPLVTRVYREADVHSLIAVPLTARGAVMGLVSFYRTGDSPSFDDEDLTVATELAERAALCLDNSRLYQREHSLAGLVRRRMIPPRLPGHSAVETGHSYLPARAGGTWFDVLSLSGARVGLVTGEVQDGGLAAVTVMGGLRATVSALAALDLEPGELLHRLHDQAANFFAERPTAPDTGPEAPRTRCLIVIYDPVTTRCTLAAADHPPPMLLLPGSSPQPVDAVVGPPLGQGEPDYPTTELDLPGGAVLALHNSAWPPHAPGTLQAALARDPDGPLQDACDAASTALFPRSPDQDILLLLARTRRLAADRTAAWELENTPESAAAARRMAARQLRDWNLDELTFTTEMVVSELITNAIRYADGPIGLRLIRETSLICEVTDNSSTTAHMRRAPADHEGGRGLFLVAQLATSWGTRFTTEGKTTWAEQPLSADALSRDGITAE
ncbi:SpoIIE family protein phosphatase [Streptomyces sp. NBRC 109706]|uniref:SpoIIE family protein phosphatase n=1 Tax=Streptomyces sp. NBRC 109706 TaxID=1550035 RepID=UPI0007866C31|nr:SpoIIE family protein phosphatase [Streptomyces sp. NBRC 109706]